MSCWHPSPWWPYKRESVAESPHSAAIAEPAVDEAPKPRRRRTTKTED